LHNRPYVDDPASIAHRQDNEELQGEKKVSDRDKHRWEFDPDSAEDYPDHDEG
jgi:Family of unknown function (DUF6335)